QGGDASALAFDAIKAARERGAGVMLMDTAGRLQNRAELMGELKKIIRVMKKVDPGAPHAVLLVLDATVGQNALSQVEIFGRVAGVTGLVMTKLDGTARGGILVAIADKFALPVHFIGVGEGVDDLEPFTARDLGPLALFFIVYSRVGIFAATGILMASVLVTLAVSYAMLRRFPIMPLI